MFANLGAEIRHQIGNLVSNLVFNGKKNQKTKGKKIVNLPIVLF